MYKARVETNGKHRMVLTKISGETRVIKGRTLFCNFTKTNNGQGYAITEMHTGFTVSAACPTPEDAWTAATVTMEKMEKSRIEREIRKMMMKHSSTTRLLALKFKGLLWK